MIPSIFKRASVRASFVPLSMSVAVIAAFAPQGAHAEESKNTVLPEIVVTGSRFASAPDLAPIGATVITDVDIRNSGVNNVNAAIRKIGGVYGRESFYGTQDFDLDLRGFGTNSSQNMVVMVDGVRLSENELSGALLSSIPIESVARIEILRGGSSVLYGDGATGGVIQITTKRVGNKVFSGSAVAEFGQFGHKEFRTSVAQSWGDVSANLNLSEQKADNYRANNEVEQKNLNASVAWAFGAGNLGLRIDSARQDSRLPGALSLAQFEQDPRQTNSPKDFGAVDTDRYTIFFDSRFGNWDLATELSRRNKTTRAFYSSVDYGDSASTYHSQQTQFAPRLRNISAINGMTNELVLGVDLIHWDRQTDSLYSQADASQKSKAVYVRDEIKFGQARLALGGRHEVFDKFSFDPAPYTNANYTSSQGLNAWELQGSYAITPQLNVFAKTGQSYRVANSDENALTPLANSALNAQTSHDVEVGVAFSNAVQQVTARVFRNNLKNEIFYDPTMFSNVNLDPTRRQGVELEAATRLNQDFTLSAKWQHLLASFTEGVNAGKEMVMVPKNLVSASINWRPDNGQSANLGLQWVDQQRYGSDFANDCSAKMPAYATVDARYAKTFGALELALTGTNLADKQYFSNAYGCQFGIYPSSGRQLKISARYDF